MLVYKFIIYGGYYLKQASAVFTTIPVLKKLHNVSGG